MTNQSPSSVDPNKDKAAPTDCKKEEVKRTNEALDEAIEESFPASDPVSMVVDGPRVEPQGCEFRPSDQHPETDRVAHPERDAEAKPQQDNEPMVRPEPGKGENQQR